MTLAPTTTTGAYCSSVTLFQISLPSPNRLYNTNMGPALPSTHATRPTQPATQIF